MKKVTRSNTKITTPSPKNGNSKSLGIVKNVFLINDNLLNNSPKIHNNTLRIQMQRLRHPGSEESAYFISKPSPTIDTTDDDQLSTKNRQQLLQKHQVFEIMEFNQTHRSWLINESFTSNGRIYITLPIDPIFFAVYYLRKFCKDKAKLLDQLEDEEFPSTIDLLLNSITSEQLKKVSDEKILGDLTAYKFNHDKTLKWLQLKVKYLALNLKMKNMNAGTSASSANYTKTGQKSSDYSENDYLQLAAEIVSAYIAIDLYDDLKSSLSIDNQKGTIYSGKINKRKSVSTINAEDDDDGSLLSSSKSKNENVKQNKKIKIDDDVIDDFNQIEYKSSINQQQQLSSSLMLKEKKQTTKEKSLAKAATGSKNISSFFQKKN